jgi:hypothetical protein
VIFGMKIVCLFLDSSCSTYHVFSILIVKLLA